MLAILLLSLWSSPTVSSDTIPFSSAEAGAIAGCVFPLGSISRHYDPGPVVGARLSASHWGNVRVRADLFGGPMEGPAGTAVFAAGSAGFDWLPASIPVEFGAGLGLFYLRTTPDPEHPRLDDGGESEFGLVGRTAWRALEFRDWTLRVEATWEEAFTRPRASALSMVGLSLSRRVW